MSGFSDVLPVAPLARPELVGPVLADLRVAAGMTQAELAEVLGVSRQYVVELEQGKVTRALAVVFEAFGHFGYALQPVAGGRDG